MIKKLLAYSKREAAAATSLLVRSLDYLIERGQLRAVKVGRRVLIPSRELERLIEKGTSWALLKLDAMEKHNAHKQSTIKG